MSLTRWSPAPDLDDEEASPEGTSAALVTLHFVRRALRRRLLSCVLSAALGLLVAAMYLLAFPVHQAKASLVLTHDEAVESSKAMDTDVSLLKTRTVASLTTARLGLTIDPDDFLKSVTVEPVGTELVMLTVGAETDAEAVRRLDALTSIYLKFRAEQLSVQTKILVDATQERINKLQADVEDLSRRIEQLSGAGSSSASKLSDMISQRAYIQSRIEGLQQSVEDATLRNSAVVESSRVLDPPTAVPGRGKRTIVLGLASGFIGGAALGCGTVLFFAITSDRLRRRADLVGALGVPVPISAGRIAPLRKGLSWLPPLQMLDRRRASERERVADAIERELMQPQGRGRLVVAGIDNTGEVGFAVAEVAARRVARGRAISVVDLTGHVSRGLRNASLNPGSSAATVLRARGVPALAHGVADLLPVGNWENDETTTPQRLSDITLVLADLDPAVGADHLTAWSDRVVVAVSAGRSSAEKIRTAAEMLSSAGLELRFAVLLHTERTDHSSGVANFEQREPAQRQADHEDPESATRLEAR